MKLAININAPTGIKIEYKMSGWKIFGIIICCLVALLSILWVVVYLCKRQNRDKISKTYITLDSNERDDIDISKESFNNTK